MNVPSNPISMSCRKNFRRSELGYYQSNIEGELVDRLHAAQDEYDGVVMNAGAYTHTSIAIADAIGGIRIPVVEIHISCILARESYRHISLIARNAKARSWDSVSTPIASVF